MKQIVLAAVLAIALASPATAQDATHVTLPGHVGQALGKPDAPLVLVEFTDVECPHCRAFHREVFEGIKQTYIDTGTVLFVHRDLPLPNHEHAVIAAHGLRCAADQGQFWPMRHMLLMNDALNADLVELAARLSGVDLGEFRICMREGRHLAGIEKDLEDAKTIGAKNTPTFVLGHMVPSGIEGEVIAGTVTFKDLDDRIKRLLAPPSTPQ